MSPAETLWRMAATESMSSRELIAWVVEQTQNLRGWGVTKLAREAGVAPNTIYRVSRAVPEVSRLSLRQLEIGLRLPDEVLLLIDSGAYTDLVAIPADDWPNQRIRTFVLTQMQPAGSSKRTSRKRA